MSSAFSQSASRTAWIALADAELLRQCEVDTYRASGPGGQKRNKTDSAVRLRHVPSGLMVIAEESRSQHENRARALKRLRAALALHVRQPLDAASELITRHRDANGRIRLSARHADFWPLMALMLDALAAAGGEVRRAADLLGLSTARLSALITSDEKVMAEANRLRREAGLKPLTRR